MKPQSQINVIPFIDIMLVLLAVVLTTATFVAQGRIPVSLPQAEHTESLSPKPATEITVDLQGNLFLADRPLSSRQLFAHLQSLDRTTPIMLRVDEQAAFTHFVKVVEQLKAKGFENLSILTLSGGA